MAREAFAWGPFIALGCGVAAGLGTLHSVKRTFHLTLAVMLIQMIAWIAIGMLTGTTSQEGPTDWQPDLCAGFFFGLVVVLPYTILGSVLSSAVIGVLRKRAGVRK